MAQIHSPRSPIVNFAIVGCGQIAQKHAKVITSQLGNTKLSAVCDLDPSRADAFAEQFQVQAFPTISQMVEAGDPPVDVVNVLTPPGSHLANVAEAVECGVRHIVVEKPLALTIDDAERMIELCESQGVQLSVVKQNRYNRAVEALAMALNAGRFGRIVEGTVRLRWCRKQDYYDASFWRGTWKMDGGVFANQAIHFIDLLNWLLGDVESVVAITARRLADIEAEDTGAALLRFQSGAIGIVEATTATRPKDLECSLSVLGEHGTVELGGFSANEIKTWNFASTDPFDDRISEYRQNPPEIFAFAHARYLEEVVRAIQNGQPPVIDGREALKSLRLVHAMYESDETRSEVSLANFAPVHSRLGAGQTPDNFAVA